MWRKKKRGSWKICALFILCQGQPNVFDVWSAQSLQIEANMHNCPSVSYLSLSHWHTVLPQATFCWLSLFCLPAFFISDPKIPFWGKRLLYFVMDTSWLCPVSQRKQQKKLNASVLFWLYFLKTAPNKNYLVILALVWSYGKAKGLVLYGKRKISLVY